MPDHFDMPSIEPPLYHAERIGPLIYQLSPPLGGHSRCVIFRHKGAFFALVGPDFYEFDRSVADDGDVLEALGYSL